MFFSNRGQVLQAFFALISACVAGVALYFLLKSNNALPGLRWVFGGSIAALTVLVIVLLFGVSATKKASAHFSIVDPYLIIHMDRDKFPRVTCDTTIVNSGDASDVLLKIEYTLRRGDQELSAPLVPGIREITSQTGQVLPCDLPPGKTFFIEAKSGIGLTMKELAMLIEDKTTPFRLDWKFVFAKTKTLKITTQYP
jgi:hypothetical protein